MSTGQREDGQASLGDSVELAVGEESPAISVKGHPIAVLVGYQELPRLTLRAKLQSKIGPGGLSGEQSRQRRHRHAGAGMG